jgi:hypothetical protein
MSKDAVVVSGVHTRNMSSIAVRKAQHASKRREDDEHSLRCSHRGHCRALSSPTARAAIREGGDYEEKIRKLPFRLRDGSKELNVLSRRHNRIG